ncbi:chaperonin 10-like protein [Paraphoma chrysanthemicola]|uniref:Chaperonin 10-like protein n=1 Tax=Paraphoma chrysanthemicola TaxID=798071 RepID=A0A8K0R5W6_9PLEO|nr:chaperonin 10-like protein [Paraphoma chrysanthemicola]
MRAIVVRAPGGPEALKLETIPIPIAQAGQVLIRIKAFGVNRSELFTRQGHSPSVLFPRVLGIEAVGVVADCPSSEFSEGDVVATAMGGLGRDFDGGYAEYTCVPSKNVQVIDKHIASKLGWKTLGAMPEMLQTSYGCLFRGLKLRKGDRLLVRGGTTSIGLAAAALAKSHGVEVAGSTRKGDSRTAELMKQSGVTHVLQDTGSMTESLRNVWPGGADKVLELVGTTTLNDSLLCAAKNGIVCMAGIVGNEWHLNGWNPMENIPSGVCLTTYSGGPDDFIQTPLAELAQQFIDGDLKLPISKVFKLEDIVEAHRAMEENKVGGKIVVLVD